MKDYEYIGFAHKEKFNKDGVYSALRFNENLKAVEFVSGTKKMFPVMEAPVIISIVDCGDYFLNAINHVKNIECTAVAMGNPEPFEYTDWVRYKEIQLEDKTLFIGCKKDGDNNMASFFAEVDDLHYRIADFTLFTDGSLNFKQYGKTVNVF